jgi:plastocyanin
MVLLALTLAWTLGVRVAATPRASLALAGGVRPQAGVDNVQIQVGAQFAFSPDSFQVTPGDQVHLSVLQTDGLPHTFTLANSTDFSFSLSNSSSDLYAFFHAHPPLVNLTMPPRSGAVEYANFTAPPLGYYEYVCLVPGHFQAGMSGYLLSGVSVGPGGQSIDEYFAVHYLIGGTVTIILFSVLALGYVLGVRQGKRKGRPRRTGPEEPAGLEEQREVARHPVQRRSPPP